jgi:predicted amino acid dehydrogenase
MKEIVNLSLGYAADNFDEVISLFGQDFRIKRLGTDMNVKLLKQLALKFSKEVDVLSISGFPDPIMVNGVPYLHHDLEQILQQTQGYCAVTHGTKLRSNVFNLALKDFIRKNPDRFKNKKVSIFSGCVHQYLLDELEDSGALPLMADPYYFFGLPLLLKSKKSLEAFLQLNIPIIRYMKPKQVSGRTFNGPWVKRSPWFGEFLKADLFIINSTQIESVDLPDLTGKTIITDYLSDRSLKLLQAKGASEVWAATEKKLNLPMAGLNVMEAILQAKKEESSPLTDEEILEGIHLLNIHPQVTQLKEAQESKVKFAFIVHPLHKTHLLKHPLLGRLGRNKLFVNQAEKAATLIPGFKYGVIRGIKSAHSGKEVSGIIYAVSETPKMLLTSPKERIYQKLVALCHKAFEEKASLIGLGAYTKIVGDAGVTVNDLSPIPVTTGNSLSAAATLWAASYGINKMGLVKKHEGVRQGTAMVVGATGSIGKVSAKVLATKWKRLIVVAPRVYKLIELSRELLAINPHLEIEYTTDANKYLSEADLIITSTSAQGEKILDISLVRPGSVICDVSRPFDISEEDMRSRPDVLVIASGEVVLPGEVELTCDIGLEGTTVYACLAETALLALEGRMESFSLSRDISYDKVIEIDALARKHGIKLSAIMGHKHEITDQEIELCRQHALKALSASGHTRAST